MDKLLLFGGIFVIILEIVGLIVGFGKGIMMGVVAFFVPPFAWWLGFEKLFL